MSGQNVSIIIVNWNGSKLLENCLTSIFERTDYPNFRVIVIDNGSTDDSVEMIRNKFPTVTLISNKRNLGFAKANNQGIKYAFEMEAKYFLLLNNDTVITQKGWLKKLVESSTNSKTGILGCKILHPDGTAHQHLSIRKTKVNTLKGAVFMIKREVVETIGLLDEKFSPAYGEEGDFCCRTRKAGFKVVYDPKVTILHVGEATAKRVFNPIALECLRFKHQLRYFLLNFPLIELVKHSIKISIIICFRKKRPQVLLPGYFGNLLDLSDILLKRKNRTAKIWY